MKSLKHLTYFLLFSVMLFLGCSQQISVQKQAPAEIVVMDMHNDAFSVWNNWHQNNPELNRDALVVHIDTHPDMAPDKILLNKDTQTNQYWEGSFIHPAVWYGIVKDIWCIQPDEFASIGSEKYYAVEYNVGDGETLYLFNSLKPVLKEGVKVKEATINYGIIEELPNLSKNKQPIFLDIDMDYFANMSQENSDVTHHIQELIDYGVSDDEIKLKIKEKINFVLNKVQSSGINPVVITMARSPNYAINEYIPFIEQELLDGINKRFNVFVKADK